MKEKYGDRFIPSRAGNNWQVNFNMIQVQSEKFENKFKHGFTWSLLYAVGLYFDNAEDLGLSR